MSVLHVTVSLRIHTDPPCFRGNAAVKGVVVMSENLEQEERLVRLPSDLAMQIDEAAEDEGITFSTWLARTAAQRLMRELEQKAIAEWQRQAGPLTEAQIAEGLARARSALGITPSRYTT